MRAPIQATLVSLLMLAGCTGTPRTFDTGVCAVPDGALRPQSNPVEVTSLSVEHNTTRAELDTWLAQLFGTPAAQGAHLNDAPLAAGVRLSVDDDPRTTDQRIARVEMIPQGKDGDASARRLITRVPVSAKMGSVFIDAVDAALARTAQVQASTDVMEPWHLDYQSVSAHGGALQLSVAFTPPSTTVLRVTTGNPETSLTPGKVGTASRTGQPFETVGGTVLFSLSRDEFDFFSRRAYGVSEGRNQNFRDFLLHPHDWLRLTVTPQYALGVVDVGFDVVTVDGRRVPLAKAPASYAAGEQFQTNVLRLLDDVKAAGGPTQFNAPFVYVDPDGGGNVSVIAHGTASTFDITYVVESPANLLQDVDFVPYLGHVDIPADTSNTDQCTATGAGPGRFQVTFSASSTVTTSPTLKAPLRGNVWGSVYKSSDVTILGPNDGAQSVADFAFVDVDITNPALRRQYEIETDLPFGDYQVLGFMDIDHNADPNNPSPDVGDPVMIPIGGFKLACELQPVVAEFGLTLPEGQ